MNAPAKPHSLAVLVDRIPDELKALRRWVLWRYRRRNGKWTKVPVDPATLRGADTTNPKHWGTFEAVLAIYRSDGTFDGVGCVIAPPYAGTDLDGSVDPVTGAVEQWARAAIAAFDTYCEVSPSGTGVKLWARGDLLPRVEDGGRRKKDDVEMYSDDRFFTVTGHRLDGTPAQIHDRHAQVRAFYDQTFGPPAPPVATTQTADAVAATTTAAGVDDLRIVTKVTAHPKYLRLWLGDATAYNSESEADLALAGRIAFFVGNDPARVESIFGHRLLAEHMTSEYRVKTTGRGRTVDEWKIRTPGADNHWLDALVGCAVRASMQGAVLFGTDAKPRAVRRIKLSDVQKTARVWATGEWRGR